MTSREALTVREGGASRSAFVALLGLLLLGQPAQAQLVSPGKLASAHAQLEGLGNCTKCHELGTRGASDTKCLSCHELVGTRIEKKKGLHATFAARTCASCHKDHFGTDFAMVRFDTAGFNHRLKTGFELRLGHLKPTCRQCHKEALVSDPAVLAYATEHKTHGRTYLGLPTTCLGCHRVDNVHADQFGTRTCTACHTEETWKKVPLFDHDSATYVLTGRHREAACEKCHKPMKVPGAAKPVTRYVGVRSSSCTACHVDRHNGSMRERCESCHDTESWTRLLNRKAFESSFDHTRTKFQLAGAHATAPCAACHDPGSRRSPTVRLTFPPGQPRAVYPVPRAGGCQSCHLDLHDSTFAKTPGGPSCENCHSDASWLPTSYDLTRHNRETYPLTGAHVAVACAGCHPPARPAGPPKFKLDSRECTSCHRTRDPHAGQFPERVCTECHGTDSFRIAAFDHSRTRYPLDGAHRNVTCAKCHVVTTPPNGTAFTRYRPLETTCRSCHGAAVPRRS